jgi:hypothetical protein
VEAGRTAMDGAGRGRAIVLASYEHSWSVGERGRVPSTRLTSDAWRRR